jgi:Zn-dependent protease/predicted transcriptional regulator
VVVNFSFVLAIFACIVLHELGHALTARHYGIATKDITLLPIGGIARLERMPDDPREELWVALAGPAVNLAISGVLFIILTIAGGVVGLADITSRPDDLVGFLSRLLLANLSLFVFNLLPAFPMDGGRALRALLAQRMDYLHATHLAASIGQAVAILFGVVGMFLNPMLLFIAIFVYIGAGQEASMVETRRALHGVPVKRAMMTRFQLLAPGDSLEHASEELLAGAQQDFPVVEGGQVVGMMTRDSLFQAFKDGGIRCTVGTIMRRDCPTVSPNELLEAVFRRMQEEGCSSLPVVSNGQLVGLVTLENIGELLVLNEARERLPRSASTDKA